MTRILFVVEKPMTSPRAVRTVKEGTAKSMFQKWPTQQEGGRAARWHVFASFGTVQDNIVDGKTANENTRGVRKICL